MAAGPVLDVQACELEPIHQPGCIQPHGLLLVVDQQTDRILQTAGVTALLVAPDKCVAGNTVRQALGVSLAALLERSGAALLREPIYLGTVNPSGDCELTLTAHLVQGVVVVEAKPATDSISAATALAGLRSITEHFEEAPDLVRTCELAAREVKRITGYDRVMIYRFLPDGSGSVIAEVKDNHLPPFLNHHFPASDIPKQALELYRRSSIRLIPDVGYIPAPLVPATVPGRPQPLDMSHCALRSVSPVHIQYLKNMSVGASMSVSLLPAGNLWGLIACHNSTAKLVPYEAREICRQVGQILSQQIRAREESDSFGLARELGAARDKVMRALVDAADPGSALLGHCRDIKAFVRSHGAAVFRAGSLATAGRCPAAPQLRDLLAWLDDRMGVDNFFETDRLSQLYPEAASFAAEASGVLSVRLPGEVQGILAWFRAEHVQEIDWAGNPHEQMGPDSRLGVLNPRESFATWRETVRGRSRPWKKI
ncbi:MAG: GAF domain-containing protein, partial [Pseudorhodoplanes sp.]